MSGLKIKMIISAASLFILMGMVTAAKPLYMGWFYQPEVQEILKGPIKKKKGVV